MNEVRVRNILKRPKAMEGGDYETLDDGMYLMGLIAVKECMKKNYFTGEEEESYRLVFRSKDNPKAFVNHTVKASVHQKAKLFSALVLMSGGKYKKLPDVPGGDPEEGFRILMASVGKWFNVMISRTDKGEASYNNVVNNSIIPAPEANNEFQDCNKWFETHQAKAPPKEADDLPTGFEDFPDKSKDLTGDDGEGDDDIFI